MNTRFFLYAPDKHSPHRIPMGGDPAPLRVFIWPNVFLFTYFSLFLNESNDFSFAETTHVESKKKYRMSTFDLNFEGNKFH